MFARKIPKREIYTKLRAAISAEQEGTRLDRAGGGSLERHLK